MRHRPKTILLVDDNPDFIGIVSQLLEKLGHVVRGESESLMALETFTKAPDQFDAAMLDVSMPELTALELAQRFRRIQRGFPVVLYGSTIDRTTIRHAEHDGIYWFKKPAETGRLKRIIGRMFG